MVQTYTNDEEVNKVMRRVQHTKSTDIYGITNEILESCSPVIERYLIIEINQCFTGHDYPDCLLIANAIPLQKRATMMIQGTTDQLVY